MTKSLQKDSRPVFCLTVYITTKNNDGKIKSTPPVAEYRTLILITSNYKKNLLKIAETVRPTF